MRWIVQKLSELMFAGRAQPPRTMSREEARRLRDSQYETLRVLQRIGEEARDEEALEYARRRRLAINRLEQEYDLYKLRRGE